MFETDSKSFYKLLGSAIFYASIQASIGSVEMSSKFSVINFSKDQQTLNRAVDALKSYMLIGIIWTIGTCLSLYATHGFCGGLIGLTANGIMMGWIVLSYINAFNQAATQYELEVPPILTKKNWIMIVIALLIALAIVLCGNPKGLAA